MIFADTSALFALFNPNDQFHNSAKEWFRNQRLKLVLTDYIVDKLLALAISRGKKGFALTISKRIRDLADVKKVSEEDFYKAWKIFDRYEDKDWSLTDCTSYVFMERSGIKKVICL